MVILTTVLLQLLQSPARVSPAAPAQPAAPVMFRGDAAHTGRYAEAGNEIIGLQWRFATGGDVVSTPAVSGDRVFAGSGDGNLYALDRITGALLWKFAAGSPVSSSPSITRGNVYFGSRDGTFYALNAASGRVVWRMKTGTLLPYPWGHESGDIWTSSPVYSNGTIAFGSGDGILYAVDAATGAVKWRAHTGGRIRGTPAAANGNLFIGSFDGNIYAFDATTGREKWHYDTEGATLLSGNYGFDRRSIQSSPSVSDGVVYIGARDGFVYAIDAAKGTLRWRLDHKISWINSSPGVNNGIVYDGSSDGHFMQAVDAQSGKEQWQAKANGVVWSSPAITDKYAYWGEGDGRIHVTARDDGRDVSTFRTGAQVYSSPVPDHNLLFVGSADGGVYALRLGTKEEHVQRAVFYDSAYERISTIPNSHDVAKYLANRGYETLDANTVGPFLEKKIRDRTPSVVVFAIDAIPEAAATKPYEQSVFRRYLNSGGKIVWSGLPPLIWPVEPLKGERQGLNELIWDAPADLLGVSHKEGIFDQRGSRSTPLGSRIGLADRWRTGWGIEPAGVTVLGFDDWGLASAWLKRYSGPTGTGFMRVPFDNLLGIYLAAEYRPIDAASH